MDTLIKITVNTKCFQDTFEALKFDDEIVVWHTYNGKDFKVGGFSPYVDIETIESFIYEFIENFYDLEQIEII